MNKRWTKIVSRIIIGLLVLAMVLSILLPMMY